MTKKTFTVIMAIALLGAFFLPYGKDKSGSFHSGLDLVLHGGSSLRFILLAFPVSALVLLAGAFERGKYQKGLFHWLPFIAIVAVGFLASKMELTPAYQDSTIASSFLKGVQGSAIGMWITAAVAILLLFGDALAGKPNK